MKLPKDVKIIKGDHGNVRARMEREDVVYQRKAGKNLHIRFIYPQQDRVERKYPLIMHIQGSAWFEQNLNDHLLDFKEIVTAGYVVAIVEYLPVPYGIFPSQVEDAKTAMRYITKHADDHLIDPDNLFVMGDSSGGHTALMCWATWNTNKLDTTTQPLPKIRAFIDLYGVVDLATLSEDHPDENYESIGTPEAQLLGGYTPTQNPKAAQKASVLHYITESTQTDPLLILHGTKDSLVPFNQSVRLFVHSQKMNQKVTFYAVEDADHGQSVFYNEQTMQVIIDFLDKHKTSNYDWF